MDQFKRRALWPGERRISPLEDDAILIRFWKRRTILQETGPFGRVNQGSARLKKTPCRHDNLKEGGIMLCVRLPSSNIRTKALLSDEFVVVLILI